MWFDPGLPPEDLGKLTADETDKGDTSSGGQYHASVKPGRLCVAKDLGIGQRFDVAGRGLVDMGVAVGTHEGLRLHAVAADLFDHVAERREGGGDLDGFGASYDPEREDSMPRT